MYDLSSDSYQVSSSLPEDGHSATYHDHLSSQHIVEYNMETDMEINNKKNTTEISH